MLNLLPTPQKVFLKKEYAARRVVVWLGAIISALIISLIMLAPSYFLSLMRLQESQKALADAKANFSSKLPSKEIVDALNAAVKNAGDLKPLVKSLSVYDLIKIFENKPSAIKIYGFTFTRPSAGKGEVESTLGLHGYAADRDSLTNFSRSLESRAEFSKVDLPVSNFVKEKDIDFFMTLTLK